MDKANRLIALMKSKPSECGATNATERLAEWTMTLYRTLDELEKLTNLDLNEDSRKKLRGIVEMLASQRNSNETVERITRLLG